jgi:hypothetical protein
VVFVVVEVTPQQGFPEAFLFEFPLLCIIPSLHPLTCHRPLMLHGSNPGQDTDYPD